MAAIRENKIILFEADTVPNANVGADYLDISGKVEYIGINEDVGDGNTELARIEKPDDVKELIDLLLTSPIKNDDNNGRNGTRYFLAFYLNDGTAIRHAYWHETGVFFRNILVPLEFKEIINSAI